MSYSDVVTILTLAPECSDIAQAALERLAMQAAGDRLMLAAQRRERAEAAEACRRK